MGLCWQEKEHEIYAWEINNPWFYYQSALKLSCGLNRCFINMKAFRSTHAHIFTFFFLISNLRLDLLLWIIGPKISIEDHKGLVDGEKRHPVKSLPSKFSTRLKMVMLWLRSNWRRRHSCVWTWKIGARACKRIWISGRMCLRRYYQPRNLIILWSVCRSCSDWL